jgi:hypothetical protein
MVVRWQCVKAVGGVDIHVVYSINISGIKKKKKNKHYQSLDMSQALFVIAGCYGSGGHMLAIWVVLRTFFFFFSFFLTCASLMPFILLI